MRLEPGAMVAGRYQVVRELARGGVASVYVAVDTKFGVRIALKIATATGEVYHEFQSRFQREARIGYLLGRAPGFVRALDWGELVPGQTLYMAMDLVEGAHELDLHSGPLDRRLRSMVAAASLVARAHEQGVIHRDLKPSNFLVGANGELHLTDFGEAKSRDDADDEPSYAHDTRTGSLVGTPLFMAPEQFESPRDVDTRADVYSLGVMLYLTLADRYPYEGKTALQIMSMQVKVRHHECPPPTRPRVLDPTIDANLDILCMSSIDLKPKSRPADGAAFLRDLRRCLGARAAPEEVQRQSDTMIMQEADVWRDSDVWAFAGETSAPPPQRPPSASGASRFPRPASRRLRRPPSQRVPAPRAAPASPADLAKLLGLDADGFVSRHALTALAQHMGPDAFLDVIRDIPALFAREERTIDGVKRYEGRVAFLLPRTQPTDGHRITVGRTDESDIVVNLVTTSKHHASFVRRASGWTVSDDGSRNGTSVDGYALEAGEAYALNDGDMICLSQHLWLEFLTPASLSDRLLQPT